MINADIIIPVRAPAPWLKETLNSAILQNGLGTIFIVDDGSQDNSIQRTVFEVNNSKCNYIYGNGHGPSSARNIGAILSNSQWSLYLDSDDILEPHALSLLLEATRNGSDLVIGGWVDVSEDGETVLKRNIFEESSLNPLLAVLTICPPIPVVLVPKSEITWDESRSVWEVTRYINRIAAKSTKISFLQITTAKIRQHYSNYRLSISKSHFDPEVQLIFWVEEYRWLMGLDSIDNQCKKVVAFRILSLLYAYIKSRSDSNFIQIIFELARQEHWEDILSPRIGTAAWIALKFGRKGLKYFSLLNNFLGR